MHQVTIILANKPQSERGFPPVTQQKGKQRHSKCCSRWVREAWSRQLGGSCHPSSFLDGKAWRADAKKDCQDLSHIGPSSFCLISAANPQTLRGLTMSAPSHPGLSSWIKGGTWGNKRTYFQVETTPLTGIKTPRMTVASVSWAARSLSEMSGQGSCLSIRKRRTIGQTCD